MLRELLLFSLATGGVVLVLVLVNLAAVPRLPRKAGKLRPPAWPSVSIVIPARNEEAAIEATVRSHLAAEYPDLEVLVVEDRSTDGTAEILTAMARIDRRLRVIPGCDPPAGWLGKPHALHVGATAARGELLLFADADVRYHPSGLREAVAFLQGEGLDFLALIPRFEMKGFWENVLMPNIPLTYFFGPGVLANLDRIRWFAAGGGAGNLVKRLAYDSAGGHAAIRDSVIDDVRLAMLVKRAGFRARAVRAEDRVTVRMYRGFREVWNGFAKNVAYVYSGWGGWLVFALSLVTILPALLPTAVLLAALFGAPIAPSDVRLAAIGFAMAIAARAPVAVALGHPFWTALTNPIMVTVWTGIIARSLYWRLVRKEVRWRGRRYDAGGATF
jgi:chlorobactene glucosyltransferase